MRVIHSADWQIGKVFRMVDDVTMAVLQDARIEGITRLGQLARRHGAAAVLVAGDIYDAEQPSDRTLDQPIERMRAFPEIEWHLIPGNHDSHRPNGLWDRVLRRTPPENVRIHLAPEPQPIGSGDAAWLLPAPLTRRHSLGDLTAWMDDAATPDGAIRLGLAHGSITQFGDHANHNLIDPGRPARAGLAYLALGDWHGTKKIGDRVWYAGTHETDAFGVDGGGQALLVEIEGTGAPPVVTPLETGRFRWHTMHASLATFDDIDVLETRLRELDPDLSRVLVDLTVDGTLSIAERNVFEDRIGGALSAAVRWLRIDGTRLLIRPSADDLDAIDHGGFVRAAAERIKALAEDPANPERETAALALERLYVLHHKTAGASGGAR